MAVNAAFFKTEYKRESAFLLTPVNSGGAKIAEQRRVNCESGWYCRGDLESTARVLKLSVTGLTEAYGEKAENGASRRIRTSDRSVRSRVLYPAELWMH